MRDDFPERIRRVVALRVGNQCSNPDCLALTSGPQVIDDKSINLGVAAHITAASAAGPRYDENLPSERRRSAENAIWLCQNCAKLIDSDIARYPASMLRGWKLLAESNALAEVGKSKRTELARPSKEKDIRHGLKMRSRLERVMLKPLEGRRANRSFRPYDKFRAKKIVIRSLDDTSYPNVAENVERIGGWFVVEPYDFYHGGLEVILSIRLLAVDDEGCWALVGDDIEVNQARVRLANAWQLGRIPWRNIREVQERGDGHYGGPHLYCAFVNDGMPYENFAAVELGEPFDSRLDTHKERRSSYFVPKQ